MSLGEIRCYKPIVGDGVSARNPASTNLFNGRVERTHNIVGLGLEPCVLSSIQETRTESIVAVQMKREPVYDIHSFRDSIVDLIRQIIGGGLVHEFDL